MIKKQHLLKVFITLIFTLSITIISFSQLKDIPTGYYNNAEGQSGYTLKTALHTIIKTGHTDRGYGALYNAYEVGDTDPEDGKVWDMYSENPDGTDPYNYTHFSNQCGNYSSEGDCYNREHLFPQGIFGSASPMKADYHHVVPSDGKVNGNRGNYAFGETNNPSWTSLNGSKVGSCSYPGYSGTIFEPIDEFKGDIARCMLYFATRYEDKVAGWSHTMLNGTSNQVYADWFIEMLVQWHLNDPISNKDIMRNEAGYDHQGNRNPFIDHPEYVSLIWGGNSPTIFSQITINPQVPTDTDEVTISANISDNEGISVVEINWGTAANALDNIISMNLESGSTYVSSTNIPAQSNLTSVYYKITVTDVENMTNASSVGSYTIGYVAPTIFFEDDFEAGNLNKWYSYSTTGSQEWIIDETHGMEGSSCAKMSGYENISNKNEDWLITPQIDLTNVSEGILSFYTGSNYDGDDIIVQYSTNYSGTGNPNDATWVEFSNYSLSVGSWEWTNSGNINLSSLKGSNIYVAFEYNSDNTNSKTWEIDNVKITGTIQSSVISNKMNELAVFPNPCTNNFTIEVSNGIENVYSLFQIDGRLIQSGLIIDGRKVIDVQNFEKGTYFLKVGAGSDLKTTKIVVE
ncbi:MAG: endonuclease [Salinivirgaceae bacterium]|nr:endonuclease [Salinivirgaceae bacterium]